MCGITFVHSNTVDGDKLGRRTADSLRLLKHRGPDGHGIASGAGWSMGHVRLSIVDLAGSAQPMWSSDGRYCLTFNGEVYNYRALRTQLEPHWSFATNGDTEVLLAGLIMHGTQFLDSAEGMWAFVLWDSVKEQLLAGRDRLGKKPLYFARLPRGIACASEIGALRMLAPEADWGQDLDAVADVLRYGHTLPGTTCYKGIRELGAGSVLDWSSSPEQKIEIRRIWSPPTASFEGTREEAIREVRQKLVSATEHRMVADVEVGAFLSGGVDSSLISAIVTRILGRSLQTFTVRISDPQYDESAFSERMAHELSTKHTVETLPPFSEGQLSKLILEHVGQPFGDTSILPTALVSRVASAHVKVALSGDGGDELFCGYERYHARTLLRAYSRLPAAARRLVEHAVRRLPEPGAHHSRSLLKKAHLFLDLVDRNGPDRPYIAPHQHTSKDFAGLFPLLSDRGYAVDDLVSAPHKDPIGHMMRADLAVYLAQDILTKVDRASMAASLEVRSPFLDSAVVKVATSVPSQWHRSGMMGKILLREAFNDIVPEWVFNRRKQGFGVPVHQWFRGWLGDSIERLATLRPSMVDAAALRRFLAIHRSGKRDHGYRLLNIYVYLLWNAGG